MAMVLRKVLQMESRASLSVLMLHCYSLSNWTHSSYRGMRKDLRRRRDIHFPLHIHLACFLELLQLNTYLYHGFLSAPP